MELLHALQERRSVRAYSGRPVTPEQVNTLLTAACQAPSAVNAQPWAFVVIQDAARLEDYNAQSKAFFRELFQHDPAMAGLLTRLADPDLDVFYGAGTLILVCADHRVPTAVEDCHFAGQNLLLAAHALGLGACMIGNAQPWLDLPHVKAGLGMPPHYGVALAIVVGDPAETPPPPERRPPQILAWL